jgi:hypothetical protein
MGAKAPSSSKETLVGICFAFPAYDGKIPIETAVHLANTVAELKAANMNVAIQWGSESALIDLCRNRLVKRFLEETDAQKLFFIDSDIIFKPKDALRLIYHSQKYPVVGAVYPVRKDPPKFFLKAKNAMLETNEDGLIEVLGFGAGFVIIDRKVFETMKPIVEEIVSNEEHLTRYFDIRVINGRYLGEDISFYCRWTDECGGSIFIDPSINLKHVGSKEFDYKLIDYLDQRLGRG